jgi:hypothetical protein
MSRDTYSYDPHDTREAAPRPRPQRRQVPVSEVRDAGADRSGGESSDLASRERSRIPLQPERLDSPRAYFDRDRTYLLRDSELRTLSEIATFRVIRPNDLAKYSYAGDRARMERDLRRLKHAHLLNDQTVEVPRKKTLRVLTLTKQGHRILRNSGQLSEQQASYHGMAKPKEVEHDAALYRLYERETARIESADGRPVRVLLDYELKRDLNRELAKLAEDQPDFDEERERIAQRHGLEVIDGKIPIPDLRIEYVNADLEPRHVDLDLVTRDYRPSGLAEKARAGFTLYSSAEDEPRLRRILHDKDLTAKILSL